jgi:hypothetical protein
MYRLITAISDQMPPSIATVTTTTATIPVDHPPSSDVTTQKITTTETTALSSTNTKQHILNAMRNLISNNEEYQFCIGALDNIEDEEFCNHPKKANKKKTSTSLLLPASLLSINRRGTSTNNHEEHHIAVPTPSSSTKQADSSYRQSRTRRKANSVQTIRNRTDPSLKHTPHIQSRHHPYSTAELINTTSVAKPAHDVATTPTGSSNAAMTGRSIENEHETHMSQQRIIWDDEEYD